MMTLREFLYRILKSHMLDKVVSQVIPHALADVEHVSHVVEIVNNPTTVFKNQINASWIIGVQFIGHIIYGGCLPVVTDGNTGYFKIVKRDEYWIMGHCPIVDLEEQRA